MKNKSLLNRDFRLRRLSPKEETVIKLDLSRLVKYDNRMPDQGKSAYSWNSYDLPPSIFSPLKTYTFNLDLSD